jgi:hypothetical protein
LCMDLRIKQKLIPYAITDLDGGSLLRRTTVGFKYSSG